MEMIKLDKKQVKELFDIPVRLIYSNFEKNVNAKNDCYYGDEKVYPLLPIASGDWYRMGNILLLRGERTINTDFDKLCGLCEQATNDKVEYINIWEIVRKEDN